MSTATISTINNYKAKEWNGKYIHEFNVTGNVDGSDETFIVTSFSPSQAKPELAVGSPVNLEFSKEYQGVKQYKLKRAGGYSGGGGGGYKKNDDAIAAMSALKTAVEYATKALPDCAPEDVTEVADRFLKWIKSHS
jgi:hypothetical protein